MVPRRASWLVVELFERGDFGQRTVRQHALLIGARALVEAEAGDEFRRAIQRLVHECIEQRVQL